MKTCKAFLDGQNVKKIDGIIALILYAFMMLTICCSLYVIRRNELDISNYQGKIIHGSVLLLILSVSLTSILKIRKQSLSTIGLGHFGRPQAIISSVLVGAYIFYFVLKFGFSSDLIFKLYIYFITVGFFEEVLVRGFMWPRLGALFGHKVGTIITGILFGFAHAPMAIILYGNDLLVSLFNNIGFGIISHLLFGYIYVKSKNIVIPSIIHGFLNAL